MTVLFLTNLNDYFKSRVDDLIKEFPNDRFVIPQDRAEGEKFLKVAEIIVSGSLTAEQIERGEKLRCIIVPWAGVNELPLKQLERGKSSFQTTMEMVRLWLKGPLRLHFQLWGES